MNKVWVVNSRNHTTYEKASAFGEIAILTQGKINIYKPDNLVALIKHRLDEKADKEDYLLISGYAFVNALAIHYFLQKFGRVKILIWSANEEIYTRITLNNFMEVKA